MVARPRATSSRLVCACSAAALPVVTFRGERSRRLIHTWPCALAWPEVEAAGRRCADGEHRRLREARPNGHRRRVRGSTVDTIERMRFPVVLFDLDGTVVDSGGIILA